MRVEIVTPPVASSYIDTDLVRLTECLIVKGGQEWHGGLLGGEYGYGCEYKNDVFEMHPYNYDPTCTCGFDEAEEAWWNQHHHEKGCFHVLYEKEEARFLASNPYDEMHKHMTKWSIEHGCVRAPFGMAVYCDCGLDAMYKKERGKLDHAPDCPVVRPLFQHYKSGIKVWWYKWIGRETTVKGNLAHWDEVIAECLNSVPKK